MAADDVSVNDIINDYFGDFYGDETTHEEGSWWDEPKCPQRTVKLSSIREISKEDYDVVKKYFFPSRPS